MSKPKSKTKTKTRRKPQAKAKSPSISSRPGKLKVLVLAGGPDRERPVSFKSGANVAAALKQAGCQTRQRDILPDDLSALDEFKSWGGDVIFPVLHGAWGEGGGLQRVLDKRRLPYVGCRAPAAELCMDKTAAKLVLVEHGLPTPAFQLLDADDASPCQIQPPLVLKPPREGSSIDIVICRDARSFADARARLQRTHRQLLAEQFIAGKEMTVGVIGDPAGPPGAKSQSISSLPPIQIVPATEFYDYQAKYDRDDTRYLFDPAQIGLPPKIFMQLGQLALETHRALGCRHMSRVDIIVDADQQPWILEVNTIPGFTSHSLLPMAARYAGIDMPALVDRLVRLALAGP